jgi:hypothetical protein
MLNPPRQHPDETSRKSVCHGGATIVCNPARSRYLRKSLFDPTREMVLTEVPDFMNFS